MHCRGSCKTILAPHYVRRCRRGREVSSFSVCLALQVLQEVFGCDARETLLPKIFKDAVNRTSKHVSSTFHSICHPLHVLTVVNIQVEPSMQIYSKVVSPSHQAPCLKSPAAWFSLNLLLLRSATPRRSYLLLPWRCLFESSRVALFAELSCSRLGRLNTLVYVPENEFSFETGVVWVRVFLL